LRATVATVIVLLLTTGAFAGDLVIQPTTTRTAESANNTSGADSFTTQTNGNPAPANISKLPVRIKCALLGWNALDEAIKAHRRNEEGLMGKRLEFEDLTSIPEGFDPAEHKEDLPS